jgi:hypothetical protein
MIKSAIKIGLLLIVGIVAYNLFFGTEQEQEQSKEIISDVKDFSKSAWGLLKTEHQKYKDGKYDDAVDKIDGGVDKLKDIYSSMREKAQDLKDSGLLDQLDDLESKRKDIEKALTDKNPDSYDQKQIQEDWKKLLNETDSVMNNIDK